MDVNAGQKSLCAGVVNSVDTRTFSTNKDTKDTKLFSFNFFFAEPCRIDPVDRPFLMPQRHREGGRPKSRPYKLSTFLAVSIALP